MKRKRHPGNRPPDGQPSQPRTERGSKRSRISFIVLLVVLALGLLLVGRYRADAPNAFGRWRISQRRLVDAQWWLEWAQRLDPNNAETEFLFARVARRKGEMAEVREHLARAAELQYPLARVEKEQWLAMAQSGQLREAEQHLASLLSENQGDGAEVCEAFVIGLLRHRRFETARELLRVWSADLPHDPQPFFYLGAIEQDQKNWDKAIGFYEKALQEDSKRGDISIAIAKCYLEKKQPTQALEHYRAAAMPDGEQRVPALVGQAHCLRELGKSAEARAPLQQALAIDADDSAANFEIAQVELEAAEFASAINRLAPLVDREPRNHDARFAYAVALRGTGKAVDAAKQFEIVSRARKQLTKATNLAEQMESPDDVEARHDIGAIFLEYGDPEEGLQWLTSVFNYDPNYKPTHRVLADFYAAKQTQSPQCAALAKHHRAMSQE